MLSCAALWLMTPHDSRVYLEVWTENTVKRAKRGMAVLGGEVQASPELAEDDAVVVAFVREAKELAAWCSLLRHICKHSADLLTSP